MIFITLNTIFSNKQIQKNLFYIDEIKIKMKSGSIVVLKNIENDFT